MQRWWILSFMGLLLSCNHSKKIPDVAHLNPSLTIERFDTAFFVMDTAQTTIALQQLNQRYPGFTADFLFNILGSTPDEVKNDVPAFLTTYQSVATDAAKKFGDFSTIAKEVKRGLQFVSYYFPDYRLPKRLITFIGPLNSYGNIITADGLAVGLQLYLGRDYPLYQTEQGQQLYPRYISRRFEPEYIPANCMKNIIDDLYPAQGAGATLIEQMVESGKRAYLLGKLLPETADTILTGYTASQLQSCLDGEQQIWSFFVQNEMLFSTDPALTRDYLGDGPNTPVFGEASPGNIGQFVGLQIVSKWMQKKKETSLDRLMKTPARRLFEEAKYKP